MKQTKWFYFALLASVSRGDRGNSLLQFDSATVSTVIGWSPGYGHDTLPPRELDSHSATATVPTRLPPSTNPRNNRSIIHILSPGRVGSCFLGDLFSVQGTYYVLEPDNGDGWGRWHSALVPQKDRIRCMYNCEGCDGIAQNSKQTRQLCNSNFVAIKSVGGLCDFSILPRSIPLVTLHASKFLILFRDPRGWLHSIVKSKWFRHGMESHSCAGFLLQYLSFKELAGAVPSQNMRSAFFEQWSQNVEDFAASLFDWAGLDMSHEVRGKAVSSHKGSALEWVSQLKPEHIEAKTHAPYCQEFLTVAGYPIAPPAGLAFVSRLNDPLVSTITDDQRLQLKHIRSTSNPQDSWMYDRFHPDST